MLGAGTLAALLLPLALSSMTSLAIGSTTSIRTSGWPRPRCALRGPASFRSGLKAPDAWPCGAAISGATRTPGKGAHSARSVQRRSQRSSSSTRSAR